MLLNFGLLYSFSRNYFYYYFMVPFLWGNNWYVNYCSQAWGYSALTFLGLFSLLVLQSLALGPLSLMKPLLSCQWICITIFEPLGRMKIFSSLHWVSPLQWECWNLEPKGLPWKKSVTQWDMTAWEMVSVLRFWFLKIDDFSFQLNCVVCIWGSSIYTG